MESLLISTSFLPRRRCSSTQRLLCSPQWSGSHTAGGNKVLHPTRPLDRILDAKPGKGVPFISVMCDTHGEALQIPHGHLHVCHCRPDRDVCSTRDPATLSAPRLGLNLRCKRQQDPATTCLSVSPREQHVRGSIHATPWSGRLGPTL